MDIIERLRFDAARCEQQFSKGVAGNIEEAAAEIQRLRAARDAAIMAKTRLDDFADKANAGQVHYDARELKRRIWAAFADFDADEQRESGQ